MNLYDADDGFRRFTLEEANEVLPEIIEITEEAVQELEALKNAFQAEKVVDELAAREKLEEESEVILHDWANRIVQLGVYPKGFFTVDFKSPIPDVLFCWTYGEESISYTHRIYESFKDRIPIEDDATLGFEQSLN
ncbi:MAG: DUF2203 family protein [Calditrichaeota bacterium]|nr:MAG: DUF2203 family protein [Calditrichota bacterium]